MQGQSVDVTYVRALYVFCALLELVKTARHFDDRLAEC
jgi:hypothetical protein